MALILAAGCAPHGEAVWMESFQFYWERVNHRLGYVGADVSADPVLAAVVGGASSTGVTWPLPEGCDSSTCRELALEDDAEVTIRWATASGRGLTGGHASVEVVADRHGTTQEVVIPLPRRARGAPVVAIRGFSMDSNEPLAGGDDCYLPAYGWLPRTVELAIEDATLSPDGEEVWVDVRASFVAGLSFEQMRECMDEVVDRARLRVRLDLQAVVAPDPPQRHQIQASGSYALGEDACNPEDQSPPQPTLIPDLSPLAGWSSLRYSFHQHDQDEPGAYLRWLSFGLDHDLDIAWGHAGSYSRCTQLSDFSFQFEGEVVATEVAAEVERHGVLATLPALVNEDGSSVLQEIPVP